MNNKLLVLGTIAYDSIESPSGSVKKILGGCATYIGLSASKFKTSSCLVSIVAEHFENSYFKINHLGRINSVKKLTTIYSSADIFIIPSRIESFGQTAAEAQSCGTPVAAFNIGGLKDIITHNKNGILILHRNKNENDIFPKEFWIFEEKKYGISKIIFISL